jgi:2-oxoisovalerate dehydrogenase E1 component alpha subunit
MDVPTRFSGPAVQSLLPSSEPVQLIDHDGNRAAPQVTKEAYPIPDVDLLLRGYRQLVTGRRVNQQASALVRQGRLAVYPSSFGQEACQVAAALCLAPGDWLFPTYRDTVAAIARGLDPVQALGALHGNWHCGYNPLEHRVSIAATPLATQLLHAVGVAHAAKMRGEDTVVLAMCGDGASSEGDFSEALNFAAVFQLPVVFLIQNNQYAISVPLSRQTAAPSLAHKGVGFGMPGEGVDGNDLAALLAVLGVAVRHARDGGGPTLVEAHTYRMEAHTNADDADRYRSREEVAQWLPKDPLRRIEAYLRTRGTLTDDDAELAAAAAEEVAAQLRNGWQQDDVDPLDLFRFVYSNPTPQLREQAAQLQEELARADKPDAAGSTPSAPQKLQPEGGSAR